MPRILDVDWPLIQSHYVKGSSATDIANEFGISPHTIRSRAKRFHWAQHRAKTATFIAINALKASETSLKQRGLAVLEMLQETVETNAKVAQKLPKPKKWSELELAERALKQLTERAKSTAGLDQQSSMTLVSIERLSVQDSDEKPLCIDVTSTKPA